MRKIGIQFSLGLKKMKRISVKLTEILRNQLLPLQIFKKKKENNTAYSTER